MNIIKLESSMLDTLVRKMSCPGRVIMGEGSMLVWVELVSVGACVKSVKTACVQQAPSWTSWQIGTYKVGERVWDLGRMLGRKVDICSLFTSDPLSLPAKEEEGTELPVVMLYVSFVCGCC